MKSQLALLAIIQNLIQDIQSLQRLGAMASEENAKKASTLVQSVDIKEAQRVAKELAKGITVCPFCEENVRQIRPHLKACKSLTPLDIKDLLKGQEVIEKEIVKEIEKELSNDDIKPENIQIPKMKLQCLHCGEKYVATTDAEFRGFWETGLPCPVCKVGRFTSDMSVSELELHKKYRAKKVVIRQGPVSQ